MADDTEIEDAGDDLSELEELALNATPGEWCAEYNSVSVRSPNGYTVPVLEMPQDWSHAMPSEEDGSGCYSTATGNGDDLLFAAAASPAVVLDLIEKIRALRGPPDWHAVALRLAGALRANIDRLVEVDAHDFTCLTTYDESQGPCDCGMPAHIKSLRNALAAEGM